MVECSGAMALVADDATFVPNVITNLQRPGNVREMNVWGTPAPLEWRTTTSPSPPSADRRTGHDHARETDLHVGWPEAVRGAPRARRPPRGRASPAFIVLHGFVGSKDESHAEIQARHAGGFGYVALRFDFRCCGESEGERAQVRCFDQVAMPRTP